MRSGLLDRSKRGVWVYYRSSARRLRTSATHRRRRRVNPTTPPVDWFGGRWLSWSAPAFLVAAVIGSGIAASRLSPDDVGLQLLENSLATGAVLVALILALQPVSARLQPGRHAGRARASAASTPRTPASC